MSKKRKSGEGTLRQRSDGRWEARIVVGYSEKGNPITKNVTAVNKDKCLEKLEKLRQEKENKNASITKTEKEIEEKYTINSKYDE